MCEDYPCCGHNGDDPCPNARGYYSCGCGRRLSKRAGSSLCASCQRKVRRGVYDERD